MSPDFRHHFSGARRCEPISALALSGVLSPQANEHRCQLTGSARWCSNAVSGSQDQDLPGGVVAASTDEDAQASLTTGAIGLLSQCHRFP